MNGRGGRDHFLRRAVLTLPAASREIPFPGPGQNSLCLPGAKMMRVCFCWNTLVSASARCVPLSTPLLLDMSFFFSSSFFSFFLFSFFTAGCVSWVMMYPPAGLPKDMVEPTIGGSDYWANKVRMQYRKTNPEQVNGCSDLLE